MTNKALRLFSVLVAVVMVATACQTGARMFSACRPAADGNPFGTDGTYVLVCRGGAWTPIMTVSEYLRIRRGDRVTIAPVPQPPVKPRTPKPTPTSTTTTTTQPEVPTQPDLSAGKWHTCAVDEVGSAWCWGAANYGQLGTGAVIDSWRPLRVLGLNPTKRVSSGSLHTCFLSHEATVSCTGKNDRNQVGPGATSVYHPTRVPVDGSVVQVSAGRNHTCALTSDGRVHCWGDNRYGQLGNDLDRWRRATPEPVEGVEDVVSIDTTDSTCALIADGTVTCWGGYEPIHQVEGIDSAIDLVMGNRATCVIREDHGVSCWGKAAGGTLGVDISPAVETEAPVDLESVGEVTSLSVGEDHACAVRSDGQGVMCWGMSGPAIGMQTWPDFAVRVDPMLVPESAGAESVTVGGTQTCALFGDRGPHCWGGNASGELGNGDYVQRTTPTPVLPF